MFGFKGIREQMIEERRKNAQLRAEFEKINADVIYIAMMSDVELETEEETEEETEVKNNGNEISES